MVKTTIANDDFNLDAALAVWTKNYRHEIMTRLTKAFQLSARLTHRKNNSA